MIRVPHDGNVLVQVLEKVLRVVAAHRHRLSDFLIHDDENPNPLLSLAQQQPVEPKVFVLTRRAPEEEFGREPPVKSGRVQLGDGGVESKRKRTSRGSRSFRELRRGSRRGRRSSRGRSAEPR